MEDSALKPCPFCGGKAYTYQCTTNRDGIKMYPWLVHCEKCKLNYPPMKILLSEKEAIDIWNKRV